MYRHATLRRTRPTKPARRSPRLGEHEQTGGGLRRSGFGELVYLAPLIWQAGLPARLHRLALAMAALRLGLALQIWFAPARDADEGVGRLWSRLEGATSDTRIPDRTPSASGRDALVRR